MAGPHSLSAWHGLAGRRPCGPRRPSRPGPAPLGHGRAGRAAHRRTGRVRGRARHPGGRAALSRRRSEPGGRDAGPAALLRAVAGRPVRGREFHGAGGGGHRHARTPARRRDVRDPSAGEPGAGGARPSGARRLPLPRSSAAALAGARRLDHRGLVVDPARPLLAGDGRADARPGHGQPRLRGRRTGSSRSPSSWRASRANWSRSPSAPTAGPGRPVRRAGCTRRSAPTSVSCAAATPTPRC